MRASEWLINYPGQNTLSTSLPRPQPLLVRLRVGLALAPPYAVKALLAMHLACMPLRKLRFPANDAYWSMSFRASFHWSQNCRACSAEQPIVSVFTSKLKPNIS